MIRHMPHDPQATRGCLGMHCRGVGQPDTAALRREALQTYLREASARAPQVEAAGVRVGADVRRLLQTRVPGWAQSLVVPVAAPFVRGLRQGAGINGLGAVDPGLVEAILPVYAKEMKRYNTFFEQQGERTAQAIIDALKTKTRVAVKMEKPKDQPSWVSRFMQPMLDPYVVGLRRGLQPLQRLGGGVVVVGGMAIMAGLGIAFLVGRWTERRRAASR